jgi:hypothetical protein
MILVDFATVSVNQFESFKKFKDKIIILSHAFDALSYLKMKFITISNILIFLLSLICTA